MTPLPKTPPPASPPQRGLLDTRFTSLADNTIDYWMLPEDRDMNETRLQNSLTEATFSRESSLQFYLHVPFCAQRCRFCAFSGGNSLDFRQAEHYVALLIAQLQDMLARSGVAGRWVRAINIGGGSPDLLGSQVGTLLRALRDLPGVDERTELAVELTLSTTRPEFIEELVRYDVTKISFGIQSFDPACREHQRQPRSVADLDRVLRLVAGRIPIVNADLITGLPGQDLRIALADLRALKNDARIHAVSSYVLTAAAAPALLAAIAVGKIPALPSPELHARMRLISYASFADDAWERRGTNTYYERRRIPTQIFERLAGNECIGSARYEDFLIGAGPQAISCMPGLRLENLVDTASWATAVEQGKLAVHLPKCSTEEQRDIALWTFPLRFEGLPHAVFESARLAGAFTAEQLQTLEQYVAEGLILESEDGYRLSILGEVFMGHLVRGLKNKAGRRAVDDYVREGSDLGRAMATGQVPDCNQANNRQQAQQALAKDRPAS